MSDQFIWLLYKYKYILKIYIYIYYKYITYNQFNQTIPSFVCDTTTILLLLLVSPNYQITVCGGFFKL